MSQQATKQLEPQKGLALPPKQRFKRSFEQTAANKTLQPVQTAISELEQQDLEQEDLEDFGHYKKASPKLVRYTPSTTAGIANPRRPRVGPEYQAVIPEWTGPK